jgi:hypothetical protein
MGVHGSCHPVGSRVGAEPVEDQWTEALALCIRVDGDLQGADGVRCALVQCVLGRPQHGLFPPAVGQPVPTWHRGVVRDAHASGQAASTVNQGDREVAPSLSQPAATDQLSHASH